MTYTPSAYAKRFEGRWWVFITTPSGRIARLLLSFDNEDGALLSIDHYGFQRIAAPTITFTNLNRGNTTPR